VTPTAQGQCQQQQDGYGRQAAMVEDDPLLRAVRLRVRAIRAPESLRARIAAMLEWESGEDHEGEPRSDSRR
jgi:hypothetical protein